MIDGFELDYEEGTEIEVEIKNPFELICESNLVPSEGILFGLDPGQDSAGFCLYVNGEKTWGNISISIEGNTRFREVLTRRALKEDLTELFRQTGVLGSTFELAIVEDAFQGENPKVTRLLYSINTALDELIVDGVIDTKTFIRTPNPEWKSWLSVVDYGGKYKGFKDKIKIQGYLKELGVEDVGKGFQDRLDANGMILGYLLEKDKANKKSELRSKKRVVFSDIVVAYECSDDFILCDHPELNGKTIELIDSKVYTKKEILEKLTLNPHICYMTKDVVKLGRVSEELKLDVFMSDGGILAFWVKSSRLKKYAQEEEKGGN